MDRRSKLCLILAFLVAALAVCVALWALFFRDPAPPSIPDIAPSVEDNALPTDDDDDEKIPQPQGGGAVNVTYSDQVTLSLPEQAFSLYFVNPARSNQSMVLQIFIEDVVVAQTGSLPPGSQLHTLPLDTALSLASGSYNGKFHLSFYDLEDGSLASLHTDIPIRITVTS